MHHLTVRVAWHDNQWNGSVCRNPMKNAFCLALKRVREKRNDQQEDALAGQFWQELSHEEMPPCIAESAGFMNESEWRRQFEHPYQNNKKTASTHGCLKPTVVKIPPYSTFAVPFAWMLRENQDRIQSACPEQFPPDVEAPFDTPWVFGKDRQEALSKRMFAHLQDEHSLVFFYCKEGQPLGDRFSRLVVGVGRILKVGDLIPYKSSSRTTYSMWDRIIQHSIRPAGFDGLLLPYHDYIRPTGDPAEDERRLGLLAEIAVPADGVYTRTFSYGAELATADQALSILVRSLEAVRTVRKHGIAEGPWSQREEWLNKQIAACWKDRGAFPGTGSALEALGMRLGTALVLELRASGAVGPEDNPWPVIDAIIRGNRKPPQAAYRADLAAIQRTWSDLPPGRRNLLFLLSRFSFSPDQARRWLPENERAKSTLVLVSDAEIMVNPYRISETDLGDRVDLPVSVGIIDRGLLPDATIAAKHPVPPPSHVGSPNDARRVRAVLVSTLREAATEGDTLLSASETVDRAAKAETIPPCSVSQDWIDTHAPEMEGVVERLDILADPKKATRITALQLSRFKQIEDRLRGVLKARAAKNLPSLSENWSALINAAIKEAGNRCDADNPRHFAAFKEQADALERVTTRKLSVLVGRAGTGKSSVVGGLMRCKKLNAEGILLLAPTGKARVRLGKATSAEAKTVAQFLYDLHRYDPVRQRPLFNGDVHRKEKTVVIDECSMLTAETLAAALAALDLGHVQRLILVGDPNQLPPIGAGRPFADLVAMLDGAAESNIPEVAQLSGALGRLTIEVRTSAGAPSDTLRLASWYTRERQPVDADRVLSDLHLGRPFNDLSVCFWETPDDLKVRLMEQFKAHLGVNGPNDVVNFDKALGLDGNGLIPDFNAKGAENFQILSPVRMQPHGVYDLNRWIQLTFRSDLLEAAREPWGISLGDEEIVRKDKVIQLKNESRSAFDGTSKEDIYLANGEVGVVCGGKNPFLNVVFADRQGLRVGYRKDEFPRGSGPLELAYCLTVHKGQGSEFSKVFVIIPKDCFNLTRELLYTALTRSRDRLILLIQGKDPSLLYSLTDKSETARRNTNLFTGVVRERSDALPYAENLIHRTDNGHMVRSKSELVIANMLFHLKGGLENYHYERPLEGTAEKDVLRPDFAFIDPAGDPIVWEHLGMLSREDYRQGWEWKKEWYAKNGFTLGQNLFTTQDDERGGLDSQQVRAVAEAIRKLL
ncbi:MAG: ATP-dependent RecD-like DNA helicase [Thermoguttaceae bacterium]